MLALAPRHFSDKAMLSPHFMSLRSSWDCCEPSPVSENSGSQSLCSSMAVPEPQQIRNTVGLSAQAGSTKLSLLINFDILHFYTEGGLV